MSKSCSRKINKIRYDNPGKPMKQTSFTVKNLGGNLPEKQSTIEKRSFRSSTKPLFLDSGPAQGLGKLGLGLRPHPKKKKFLRKKKPHFS